MSDVDRLFAEYVAEYRAGGGAEPSAFLARASPAERRELAALIDAFLVRAPRQPFDEGGFRAAGLEQTLDELERVLGGRSGLWPALLPRLRDRAGLKRSELVKRLATALGVADKTTKVAAYYHQMEQGLLSASGVSDKVLDALASIVGETTEALREAGRTRPPEGPGAVPPQAAFARLGYTEPGSPAPAASSPPPESEQDEVDRLFQGG